MPPGELVRVAFPGGPEAGDCRLSPAVHRAPVCGRPRRSREGVKGPPLGGFLPSDLRHRVALVNRGPGRPWRCPSQRWPAQPESIAARARMFWFAVLDRRTCTRQAGTRSAGQPQSGARQRWGGSWPQARLAGPCGSAHRRPGRKLTPGARRRAPARRAAGEPDVQVRAPRRQAQKWAVQAHFPPGRGRSAQHRRTEQVAALAAGLERVLGPPGRNTGSSRRSPRRSRSRSGGKKTMVQPGTVLMAVRWQTRARNGPPGGDRRGPPGEEKRQAACFPGRWATLMVSTVLAISRGPTWGMSAAPDECAGVTGAQSPWSASRTTRSPQVITWGPDDPAAVEVHLQGCHHHGSHGNRLGAPTRRG